MTERNRPKSERRNLNPSHQLNLNTKDIHATERSLNKIAIDALIREQKEDGNKDLLLYLNFIEIRLGNKNKQGSRKIIHRCSARRSCMTED